MNIEKKLEEDRNAIEGGNDDLSKYTGEKLFEGNDYSVYELQKTSVDNFVEFLYGGIAELTGNEHTSSDYIIKTDGYAYHVSEDFIEDLNIIEAQRILESNEDLEMSPSISDD